MQTFGQALRSSSEGYCSLRRGHRSSAGIYEREYRVPAPAMEVIDCQADSCIPASTSLPAPAFGQVWEFVTVYILRTWFGITKAIQYICVNGGTKPAVPDKLEYAAMKNTLWPLLCSSGEQIRICKVASNNNRIDVDENCIEA